LCPSNCHHLPETAPYPPADLTARTSYPRFRCSSVRRCENFGGYIWREVIDFATNDYDGLETVTNKTVSDKPEFFRDFQAVGTCRRQFFVYEISKSMIIWRRSRSNGGPSVDTTSQFTVRIIGNAQSKTDRISCSPGQAFSVFNKHPGQKSTLHDICIPTSCV
jgi:hypothetical protein